MKKRCVLPKDCIYIEEVSRILRRSPSTIYRMCSQGVIFYRKDGGRRRLFYTQEIKQYAYEDPCIMPEVWMKAAERVVAGKLDFETDDPPSTDFGNGMQR